MSKSNLTTPVRERRITGKDPYTLFDIREQLKEIIREITEAQEEKNAELVSELTDELLDALDLLEDKHEATVFVIKNSLAAAEYNKGIADQFQAIATAHNNLAKRLKERLDEDMRIHGVSKLDAGIFTIRKQRNSIATLTVHIPAEELPERFHKIIADTDELRFAIDGGEEVDGVTLIKGEHIRIVPKK